MPKYGQIKGLNKVLKELKDLGVEGEKRIAIDTETNAREIEANAKINAPFNLGDLRQGIKALPIDDLNWKIQSTAPYAAYLEFGTGENVKVPTELKDVAIKFKNNKKGSFKEGLIAIKDWCKNKGIPEEAAYPIFIKIITQGISAKPYLYPAFVNGRKNYISDLKKSLKDLTKKV